MSLLKNIRAARALASTKRFVSATSSVVGKDNGEDMIALIDTLLFAFVHDHAAIIELIGDGDELWVKAARQSILRTVGKLPASLWDQIALGRKAASVRAILDAVESAHMDVADFVVAAANRFGFSALIADETEAEAAVETEAEAEGAEEAVAV